MAKAKSEGGRESKSRSPGLVPSLKHETGLGYPRIVVVGIDEVGRGCLAGPVVAGALILPEQVDYDVHPWLKDVSDSKCVEPEMREELAPKIQGWARSFGIGVASVEEIDRINIFHASHLAMLRAAETAMKALRAGETAHALVDGKFLPKGLPCRATAVIKGDLQCLSIAAASILAKVWRDRRMVELDREFPGYGFSSHKGYSTPAHKNALKKLGACVLHRRSFAPVAEELESPFDAQVELF